MEVCPRFILGKLSPVSFGSLSKKNPKKQNNNNMVVKVLIYALQSMTLTFDQIKKFKSQLILNILDTKGSDKKEMKRK